MSNEFEAFTEGFRETLQCVDPQQPQCVLFPCNNFVSSEKNTTFPGNMWPNTTKGTSCLLLSKFRFLHYLTRGFNKLSNDITFIKFEVILLKIQFIQSVNCLLFSLYFTHCFVHYFRINLSDKMYLLLYWRLLGHIWSTFSLKL